MKPQLFLSALLLVLATTIGLAPNPQTVSYQGFLNDASGRPAPDGNYTLTVRLYQEEIGGVPLWAETQSIAVANGVFSVTLGKTKPLPLQSGKKFWLGHSVGVGVEFTPRIPFAALASDGKAFAVVNKANGDLALNGCLFINGACEKVDSPTVFPGQLGLN